MALEQVLAIKPNGPGSELESYNLQGGRRGPPPASGLPTFTHAPWNASLPASMYPVKEKEIKGKI